MHDPLKYHCLHDTLCRASQTRSRDYTYGRQGRVLHAPVEISDCPTSCTISFCFNKVSSRSATACGCLCHYHHRREQTKRTIALPRKRLCKPQYCQSVIGHPSSITEEKEYRHQKAGGFFFPPISPSQLVPLTRQNMNTRSQVYRHSLSIQTLYDGVASFLR